ncbi:hypothetical protein [Tenacibaculum holothuriorum]|uniref:hypothetical protein n=1 Tax=Tenacibaculum holothuriorum TaxID=1635173 RepID=UPI000A32A5E4|nr:hypothetical protein [Tenacibaculum holothuriorum]
MNNSERLRKLSQRTENQSHSQSKTPFQWRPFIALIGVILIFILNWQWAWGILFLYWVIPDIFRGVTYFIEPVERERNPLLFWSIVISWIIMSLFSLSTLFITYN